MTGRVRRPPDYDVIVVGSGFGGSVTALRLTEKGYRVGVLEAGRRFTNETLPKTSWDVRSFLWAPKLGCRGIQRLTLLRDVLILSGAGVGGGSLVYANTLYEPAEAFYDDPQWRDIADWRAELAPYYDQAKRMLGVVETPIDSPADGIMRQVAEQMGVGHTFRKTPVGVFFGPPGQRVPDPYFGGAGPERAGCIACGACMTGCRHDAKNRLDLNYLYLAERGGAVVHPESEVRTIRPVHGGGYAVVTAAPGASRRAPCQVLIADQVVLAAGALGTQKLLHELRDTGVLPLLSARLGHLTRTNSEAILGATAKDRKVDYSRGIAITSSFHPDEHTHIEPVRYGRGDNAMGLLGTILVDGGGSLPRWLRAVATIVRHPVYFARSLSVRRWSERTIIVLVMQSLDNSIRVFRKHGLFGSKLSSTHGTGEPNPTWIPEANEAARRAAALMGGEPGSALNEAFLNVPTTAHIIGGAVIGASPDSGVVDPYHRVFGYDGLHVIDGSAIPANLGVNPSLSITALAERAAALWPNKGEPDPRPAPGSAYRAVTPVTPKNPMVPAHAPAALRW